MTLSKNDINRLFPGQEIAEISFLPLLEDFFEGVIFTDDQGRVLFMNQEQARIDDLSPGSVRGRKVTEIYHVDDGASPTMQCLKTGKAIKGLACYYRTWTGKIVNSTHNIFPLYAGGRLVGSICFIQDFSVIEQRFDAVFQPEKLKNLQAKNRAGRRLQAPQFRNGTRFRFRDIIGTSRELTESLDMAKLSAQSVSPVMLYGETGTGKELVAQSIHNAGPRQARQYVAVNCAAIPENLLEGILFGTSKGAFTGAVDKPGLFEKADGGTLFLDEVNAMTGGLQAKLLRVLQERKVRRVGSLAEIEIDIKLISSVNRNPHTAIADGSLRSDLFYRLAVVFIRIPPLRDRREDLPLLIPHFLKKAGTLVGRQVTAVSDDVASLFNRYPWPGNIRELEHVIEGAMNLAENRTAITLDLMPSHLALPSVAPAANTAPDISFSDEQDPPGPQPGSAPCPHTAQSGKSLARQRRDNEILLIRSALAKTKGRPSAASRLLGISPQLLNYKLKTYRIDRRAFQP